MNLKDCYYTCAECSGPEYDDCTLCAIDRGQYSLQIPLDGTCPCDSTKVDLKDPICQCNL